MKTITYLISSSEFKQIRKPGMRRALLICCRLCDRNRNDSMTAVSGLNINTFHTRTTLFRVFSLLLIKEGGGGGGPLILFTHTFTPMKYSYVWRIPQQEVILYSSYKFPDDHMKKYVPFSSRYYETDWWDQFENTTILTQINTRTQKKDSVNP